MNRTLLSCLVGILWQAAAPAADRLPPVGSLQVVSEPSEAAVWIDRVPRGSTPLALELPAGEHLLHVRRDGWRPEYRNVTVDDGGRSTVRLDLTALTGLLLVDSTPTNAEVTIDGADYGRTPAMLASLPLGAYRLRVTLPGFQPKELDVQLQDRTPRRVAVDLTSDSATLVIGSQPEGAEVSVNGIARGATPCRVERIPEGSVSVEVRAAGYLPFTQTLRLSAGEVQSLEARLEERPARLQVVSLPDKARVYVNNEFRGETPLTLPALAPGEHRVRVELAGFDPTARTVTLQRGDERTEEFRLLGNTGRLQLTTEPAGATLLVDGQPRGATVAAPGEQAVVSAPLTLEHLAEGEHVVQVSRQGFFAKQEKIVVVRGQTKTMHFKLERRFIPNYEVVTPRGVYRGVLDSITDEAIRLETAPGVIATYLVRDVRRHGPLGGSDAP